MSGVPIRAGAKQRDRMVFAVVLIVVGIGSLALQTLETTTSVGGWIVLVIGLGFLGAFAFTRQYGYLVPGGIMAGLGAGILASESIGSLSSEQTGGAIVLGLGAGFIAIWLIGGIAQAVGHHFWPLIPGGILAVIGVALLIGGQAVDLLDYWGVVIIGIGLIVLLRAWSESRRTA